MVFALTLFSSRYRIPQVIHENHRVSRASISPAACIYNLTLPVVLSRDQVCMRLPAPVNDGVSRSLRNSVENRVDFRVFGVDISGAIDSR